jgi:alkylated DNA repair dioxygenase AlkB
LLIASPNLAPYDGELYLLPGFFPQQRADAYFRCLAQTLDWRTEELRIYGRRLLTPRLMAWYGDAGANYKYSGVEHSPLPWTKELLELRTTVEARCEHRFNSVLANLYRDGRDSMGCHADDEKALGDNPLIASLSFGATRLLRFKHPANGGKVELVLAHGDLLIMAGALQHFWRHELPKTRKIERPRINLTFRAIQTSLATL